MDRGVRRATRPGASRNERPATKGDAALARTLRSAVHHERSAHDKLRYAQRLLSHQLPSGDFSELFERVLDALIPQLEKRKFAAAEKPHTSQRSQRAAKGARYVPANVKRRVWRRDQGQCTFVSEAGHRCPATNRLEFDHVDPVARGGRATVDRIRLRCRPHNQYDAERTFGAEFMRHKRERARCAAAAARAAAKARA
jgi:5-methylcytosine-specific restriction endonuclease McrA